MRESLTYATLVGLVAYSAIATDLYLPALPDMTADFGVDHAAGQLSLSTFMVGIALGQLVFGPLSDQYGRLPVVRMGTLLFLITSIACAAATSMEFMWLARAAQGFAAASGPVIARAMVRDRYQGHEAAQVMATLGAAMAVVPLLAPTLGSWLLVWFDWRATFGALALFALIVFSGLGLFAESAPPPQQERLSVGAVLGSFGTFFSDRRFVGYQMIGTASFSAIFAFLSTVSYFMRDVFAVAPENFGYAFAISVSGYMIGSLSSSRLVPYLGPDNTMRTGTLLSTAAALALLIAANLDPVPVGLAAVSSFSVFLGIGLTFANAMMGAVSLYPNTAGAASAAYGFTHATSAAAVGVVAGHFYDGSLVPTTAIMLVCCGFACIGLVAAREIPDQGRAI